MRMSFLALSCLVMAQATASTSAGDTPTQDACPAPTLRPPNYPPELAMRHKGGTVVLDLAIDGCGRVVSAATKSSSGLKALDQAALAAAREWVLPAVDRAKAVDGHVERALTFNMSPDRAVAYAELDWPQSHKRPRYVWDASFNEYATAAAASSAIRVPVERTMAPPYKGIQSQFFRYGESGPGEYWLFLYRKGQANLAARYRLVTEDGAPVVRLAIVCDDAPEACETARKFLLKGLPFAKAQ